MDNQFLVNLKIVRENISKACRSCGRSPEEITIIAVTKTFPAQSARDAVAAGLTDIGESRVQEAASKIEELGPIACYHLIGHLQSNKVKRAVQLFDFIQSVDSLSLAQEIDKRAREFGKEITCLIEVNSSNEPQKYGLPPAEIEPLVRSISELKNIKLAGLMTIGPLSTNNSNIINAFKQTYDLFQHCRATHGPGFNTLSMGMSGDYELAIPQGATMLRLGSALFGQR